MSGVLFLIPTVLSEDNARIIPEETLQIVYQLKHFIVEDAKTARQHLKLIKYPQPLQETQMNILNEHSTRTEVEELLKPILAGFDVGLLSEAGCPGVADPGSEVVRLAHQHGISVKPLTGPSSILLALIGSGMNGQNFAFNGYLPKDKLARIKAIKNLEKLSQNQTQIFIEAPYRVQHVIDDLLEQLDINTRLCIAVELTAKEEFIQTKTIAEWRRSKPQLNKKQIVFLIGK